MVVRRGARGFRRRASVLKSRCRTQSSCEPRGGTPVLQVLRLTWESKQQLRGCNEDSALVPPGLESDLETYRSISILSRLEHHPGQFSVQEENTQWGMICVRLKEAALGRAYVKVRNAAQRHAASCRRCMNGEEGGSGNRSNGGREATMQTPVRTISVHSRS